MPAAAAILGGKAVAAAKAHSWLGAAHSAKLGGVHAHSSGGVGAAQPPPAAAAPAAAPAAAAAAPAPAPAAAATPAAATPAAAATTTTTTTETGWLYGMFVGGLGGICGGLFCGAVAGGATMYAVSKLGVDREREAQVGLALSGVCGCCTGALCCPGHCCAGMCCGGMPACCIAPAAVLHGTDTSIMAQLAYKQRNAEAAIATDVVQMLSQGRDSWPDVEQTIRSSLLAGGIEEKLRATFDDARYKQLQGDGLTLWVTDYFDAFLAHVAPALVVPVSMAALGGEAGGSKPGYAETAGAVAERSKRTLDAAKAQREQLISAWTAALLGKNESIGWDELHASFLGGDSVRMMKWFAATHSVVFADTPLARESEQCVHQ
eukprot:TRINITY_DN13607_c1_g1_i1.p1 TRINITY_DN13607_c1_g1~~TRINITY_DN13607_c1_g1_i1.p1  ORF type:complete len:376 (+),score=109.03 TRINITY_DN13607_c1_g1_i1:94-1221(+)